MGFALKLEGLELEAREILGEAFEYGWEDDNAWGYPERALAKAFEADSYSARPGAEWIALAGLLEGSEIEEERGKLALRRLVRRKALRSYNEGGKRYYEVNFS